MIGTHSYINILLSAYVSIGVIAVRDVIRALLWCLLSESILFEHDPEEVESLRLTRKHKNGMPAPVGAVTG